MQKKIEWHSQIYIISRDKILINLFILFLLFLAIHRLTNITDEKILITVMTTVITIAWPSILRLMSDKEYSYLQIFIYKKVNASYILSDEGMVIKYLKRVRLINYKKIISFSLVSPFNFGRYGEMAYAESTEYSILYMAIKNSIYTEILPIFITLDKKEEIINNLAIRTKQEKYLNTESKFLMNFGYLLIGAIILGFILFVYF